MEARLLLLAVLLGGLQLSAARALPAGEKALEVCLLTPVAREEAPGLVQALTPVADPTLFARGQFEDIRLERGNALLWSRQARIGEPLEGPQAWPLAPLLPGEHVLLRLRPLGAGPADYASIELIGGSAVNMRRQSQLRQALGSDPAAWLKSVNAALQGSRPDEALALLFDVRGPASPELNVLRREVHDQACGSAIVTPDPAIP